MNTFLFDLQRFVYIYNNEDNTLLSGTKDNDEIDNEGGNNVTIDGGAANDKIYSEGVEVSIKGGEGSDTIQVYGSVVTVDGGAGNDYIESEENEDWYGYNLITGGAGNDTIYTTVIEGYNTLTGGAGADLFIYELYRNEEGSDTITDYAEEDTIKFNSAIDTVLTTDSGSVIFELGWHRLVLQNAADKVVTYIDHNGTKKTFKKVPTNPELITLTEGDDEYSNYLEGATIDALGGNDYIFNEFSSKVSISSGTGDDTIENWEDGTGSTLDGGGGNDYIDNSGSNVTIDAGDGDDTITNNANYVTIDAGTGDDYIFSYESKAKINGGAGNDTLCVYNYNKGGDNTLTGGKGSDLFKLDYIGGSIVSTDIIADYSEEDTIYFYDAINKISTNSSGSVIFTVGKNKLVVKNAANKVVTYIDEDGNTKTYSGSSGGGSSSSVLWSGANSITAAGIYSDKTYKSTTADQNSVLVSLASGTVHLVNPTVTKSGDSDGGDNCNFYGTNSAVLAMGGGTVSISGGTVTATAKGANGVFSYGGNGGTNGAAGDGTTIIISDVTINTTGNNGGGIMTTGGGVIKASNLTITTSGNFSAPIRTDRGGGNVTVSGGSYTSNGLGSPAIYSTADIVVSDATLTSNLSEGICIEGENSVALTDCTLTANNTQTNGNAQFLGAVILYQSQSGDAADGTSTFSMTGGAIVNKSGHIFHVTNTTAIINLEGVIIDDSGDGVILSVCDDGWSGASNVATLNASGQTLTGDILVGSDSTLTLNLSDFTYFTGNISGTITTASGTYVSSSLGTVSVSLDETSKWYLTGDTYIKSFDGTAANVITGSYKLYVDGTALSGTTESEEESALIINNTTNATLITGTALADSIINSGENVTINALCEADTIENSGANVSINAGDGDDSIQNSDDSVTIIAGDGNDSIYHYYGRYASIDAGAGDDTIYNWLSSNVTIEAGAGNDYMENNGTDVVINGGAGDDTLYNNSDGGKTLTGGAGSDLFIFNYGSYIIVYDTDTITDYEEADTIKFENFAVSKVSTTSAGNVIFKAGDHKLVVNNAADKVVTYIDADGNTKTFGGSSADTWTLDGTTATYGSLTVKGVTSLDGLSLSGKTVTVSAASLGTNKVTISDGYTLALGSDVSNASTKKSWTLKSSTATYKQTTTAGYSLDNNAITYSKKSSKTLATVKGVTSLDGLKVSGKTVTVSAESLGTNKVTISDGYTLKLGDVDKTSTKESWTLKSSTATYKQTTTAGYSLEDNAITYTKKSSKTLATVKGVTSTKGLKVSGKVVTVSAASLGTNKVTISDGYTLKLGDVDKTSTKESWTLKSSTATYKQTTTAGYSLEDNAITYTKKSSKTLATVKGVNDKSGLKVSGKTIKLAGSSLSKKVTVSGAYTFDFASDYSKATITGSSSDDTIIARGKNILVKGGKGADTIQILGTGTISGYEEGDKISLSSAANISTDGSDLIFNGKVTVTGAADKAVTYIEGGVEKIYEPEEDKAVEFNAKGTAVTLNVTYEEDRFDLTDYPAYKNKVITIKASAVKHSLEINGNKNANKITGTSEDDIIDGKEGGDTIGGGAGNDSIVGGKGNDSLNGGANNDSLWGGIGDDTLVGGVGEDIFIYQDGDGKDVIADYAPGIDKVMILSGEVKSPTADTSGDVTFQIGKGQITFTDSAKKYIELVDPSGNRLGRYNPN